METVNPANGEREYQVETDSDEIVTRKIERASEAFSAWRLTPMRERAALMNRTAGELEKRREDLAATMAREMGKPVTEGRSEIDKCAWVCRYFAEKAGAFLAPRDIETDQGRSYVCYQAIGVILAVMPWNFPFWQVFRFAAPNLMAGNAALLKHASNVPQCAMAIEEILRRAGAPPYLFQNLFVPGSKVGTVVSHPAVQAVTLTGSTNAGRSVAGTAGSALKKTVMELGGSDAYVVLEDADLEAAASTCVQSRLINGGQSCIAAKRFIIVAPQRQRFEELVVQKMRAVTMGDPLDDATQLGPMARFDLRDELHAQVMASVRNGARLLLGGTIPGTEGDSAEERVRKGAYYPPTVLTGVVPGMPAYHDELFGPVAAIIPAVDQEDAIRIANDTCFGLGAAVFTRNLAEGERLAREELQAGTCVVNKFVASDPRLPFGGIKQSGYGRELAEEGIREFTNIKTVVVARD